MIRIYKILNGLTLLDNVFYLLIFLFIVFFSSFSFAQKDSIDFLKPVSDSILREGIEIFECTKASQVSFNFVVEKLSVEDITGSLTYKKSGIIHSVFLKGTLKKPGIRYTFSFPSPFDPEAPDFDGEPRPLSDYELSLNEMRKKVLKLSRKRKSFFSNYSDVVLTPVFILRDNFTFVYLLSSSHESSFIPFGNDYLLVFNEKGKLISREKIHQNLIDVAAGSVDSLKADEAMASFHTHSPVSSPFITSTDICTLLMNKEKVNWESHIVVSDEYVSFFFPEKRILEIITREEYERISGEQKR